MCLQSQRCLSEENLSLFVPAVSAVGHLLSCPQQGSIKKIKIYLLKNAKENPSGMLRWRT